VRTSVCVPAVTIETEVLVMLGLFVAGLWFLSSGLTQAQIMLSDEGHDIGVARDDAAGGSVDPSTGVATPVLPTRTSMRRADAREA
jgi:hypothetical protein